MLKTFISICTDGASANIGCNDSLVTRLAEEHPDLIPFWCIVHQLELAIKDSIGDGLLHDIKECLLKLYYLYNKSTKKLRSLKELISELDGLSDLNDNTIGDDGVAPIKACGTKWIGHLVNALQRAINKFGIYLKDIENLAKTEKKANKKAELLGFISRWRDYRQCARVRVPLSIAPFNLYLFNLVINIWKFFMFFYQVLTLTSTLFTRVK